MDIEMYFEPLEKSVITVTGSADNFFVADLIKPFTRESGFPDLSDVNIALVGVLEDRKALKNKGCAKAPDKIRSQLYPLLSHWNHLKIADLGNIKQGNSIEDTYFAVKEVTASLIRKNILTIIIGGSQDLTYANYLAYENIGRVINIAAMDAVFDLGQDEEELNARSYLSRIIMHQPNFLFNYTNIGYQSYFVNRDALQLMKNLFFEINRLGNVRADISETEPMVRNADMMSIDISAIRAADAPGSYYAGPNGLNGEEACRICRYAGMNDKLTSIGFYEYNPDYDHRELTAQLTAQMIWYFLDGVANRQNDIPHKNSKDFIRFRVYLDDYKEELFFLKSKKTDRWWIEIPVESKTGKGTLKYPYTPCSYADYQQALNQELPDRWWRLQQKLM
ncbi:formimidoylglutamase [Candidatus Sulfidibacterium hydrothermale]|jgi:arginase family enzyme|uniref:formimidoylglutamase n=1 Tax=Candidatus Sulfidibacterium hydrothermale TaxID=2875962 RepID=UPI001F0B4992|nr:formimidoylglutamase [Candidatus Sulfidibacterium hydrothermale]UBM62479.1 formimidoylglutamase [Candidatus Sulfidibacterium hydrothermale]